MRIAAICAAERCGLAARKPGLETSCDIADETSAAERDSTDMMRARREKRLEYYHRKTHGYFPKA